MEINKSHIGSALVIIGSLISIIGTLANNLMLDHILAMRIWTFSNILLFAWAFGFWRKWWTNGIGAFFLMLMYGIYTITNEIGLTNSW